MFECAADHYYVKIVDKFQFEYRMYANRIWIWILNQSFNIQSSFNIPTSNDRSNTGLARKIEHVVILHSMHCVHCVRKGENWA